MKTKLVLIGSLVVLGFAANGASAAEPTLCRALANDIDAHARVLRAAYVARKKAGPMLGEMFEDMAGYRAAQEKSASINKVRAAATRQLERLLVIRREMGCLKRAPKRFRPASLVIAESASAETIED